VRAFVAVWPDGPTRRALAALRLPPGKAGGAGDPAGRGSRLRVVRPDQWHVTLRFLGNVDPGLVPALLGALEEALADEPPVLARLGPTTSWFGRGSVLQVPVAGLEHLAGVVRAATAGIVPGRPDDDEGDDLPFSGHLTLARAGRRGRLDARRRAELAGVAVSAAFTVDRVDLVASEPTAGGHRYRVLGHAALGRAAAGNRPGRPRHPGLRPSSEAAPRADDGATRGS